MEKLSYALGMVIGHNLKNMSVNEINAADFAAAVSDVLAGNTTKIDDAEAQQIVNTSSRSNRKKWAKLFAKTANASSLKTPRRKA